MEVTDKPVIVRLKKKERKKDEIKTKIIIRDQFCWLETTLSIILKNKNFVGATSLKLKKYKLEQRNQWIW